MTRQSTRLMPIIGAALLTAGLSTAASAQKTMTADLVVIGAGTSGTSAARQAQMLGVKDVVLLEKQPITGGTGNFCQGMFAAETSMQAFLGIAITKEFAFKTMMDYSHWMANPRLIRAYTDQSSESFDWMKENGITFRFVGATLVGGPMTWHVFDGGCKQMNATLLAKFKENGGKVFTSTPGKSLIKDNGAVVGVVAEQDGQPLQIRAKAVIVATGGYANSKELLTKYAGYPDTIPIGNIGKDGDGIKMSWAAGAAEEGMGILQTYRPGLAGYPNASHLLTAARQPILWVDKNGRRFFDESNQSNWPFTGNALVKVGGTGIAIYDADMRRYMVETHGIELSNGVAVPVGAKLTKLDEEFAKEEATGKGNAASAGSIAELAQKLKMNPAVLTETINLYNGFAEAREDGQFYKSAKYLQAVKKPPFYAIKVHPMMLGTLGGVKIDERTRAVNKDGDPVPGLYVIGNDAGGLYGDSYDLVMSGSTAGWAVNSGRLAAKNAAKYISTLK
jgi:fumarate reductase flavoprotein subunit